MTLQEQKLAALMAVAETYFRKQYIQYDQLSMDRMVRVTPRNDKTAAPEQATGQHTLYLDCSSFVNACYCQTFGQVLESALTWHMVDLVKPCVYNRVYDGTETAEDLAVIRAELEAVFQPGDLFLMIRKDGHGHVMMIGEGVYYHCVHKGRPDSYRYADRCDNVNPGGEIYKEPIEHYWKNGQPEAAGIYRICDKRISRITVVRPLDRFEAPTEQALLRIGEAAGLDCRVISSYPGGTSAAVGDTVAYCLLLENCGKEKRIVQVAVSVPECAALADELPEAFELEAGAKRKVFFALQVTEDPGIYLDAPEVTVNGLKVWAPRALIHSAASEEEAGKNAERFAFDWSDDEKLSRAALLRDCFFSYDSRDGGDVLWRRPQQPRKDGSVYSYFGGIGVITPEIAEDHGVRTSRISMQDIRPGDVILCSEDAMFHTTYGCKVTADGLAGRFGPDQECGLMQGSDAERWIDSLPGRFCYIVLRPAMIG